MNSPAKPYAKVRLLKNGIYFFDGQDWTREIRRDEVPHQTELYDGILERLNSDWAHNQIYSSFIGFRAKMNRMLDAAGFPEGYWKLEEIHIPPYPPAEPGLIY